VGAISLSTLWWKREQLSDALAESAVPGSPRKASGNVSLLALMKLRLTWFAFSFFFFSTLVLGALQNFGPPLLRDLYGLSLAGSTSALTAYLIGGAAGLAAGGFVASGAKGHEKLVGISYICAAALALLLSFAIIPGWSVIGIMAVMGFGVGIVGPSRDMLVRKSTAARLGTGVFGRIYGLVYSGLDVGFGASPLIFGILMDAGMTHFVLVGVSVALIFAVIAAQAIAAEANRPSQS
jgi:MFS family permease